MAGFCLHMTPRSWVSISWAAAFLWAISGLAAFGQPYAPLPKETELRLIPAEDPRMPAPSPPKLPTLSGQAYNLPVMPALPPRPPEGPEMTDQWRRERTERAAEPTARFAETLSGNDAVLELVVGQGRLLTLRSPLAAENGAAVVAVGDPTVVDFEVLPNPRLIRLTGNRAGVTDLSFTTSDDQTYSFEVHVLYDLDLLRAQLRQVFPTALLEISQIREHLVVEGQARNTAQVSQITQVIQGYLDSVQASRQVGGRQAAGRNGAAAPPPPQRTGAPGAAEASDSPQAPLPAQPADDDPIDDDNGDAEAWPGDVAGPEARGDLRLQATAPQAQVINLVQVPGVHQVLLQVRVAELNRTGLREIGADFLVVDPASGSLFGTAIGGGLVDAVGVAAGSLSGTATAATGPSTTAFGIFPGADFEILLRALRRNSLATILAEPNLVAMSGQQASFLAGGEFPVPVAQAGAAGAATVTVEWKEFGVQLDFVPYVLDEETIRMTVSPEVSSLDFAAGTTLFAGGAVTPGVATRRATTTVEMAQGQTLAIAGLLQVEIDGNTSRIPGLGDLPYIGPFFSNTSHRRVEKELVVLVTPSIVSPMDAHQVPPLPGSEIDDPNDLEFYLLNRIEGRTGIPFRATTAWDDPWDLVRTMKLEHRWVQGSVGFSE